MYLLDANVLIALLDPLHEHHEQVSRWFAQYHKQGWATCPLTENATLRILGHPNYPHGGKSTRLIRELLHAFCLLPGHQFWPDSLSFCDKRQFPTLPNSRHLTDLYLLALAIHHKGFLVTLDKKIESSQVTGGESAYLVL